MAELVYNIALSCNKDLDASHREFPIIKSLLLLLLFSVSTIPFLLISAVLIGQEWILVGLFFSVFYHSVFVVFGGNLALAKLKAFKITKKHPLNIVIQNLSCLLGVSQINLKVTKAHPGRVFLIERIFQPGYLVFGERVLNSLTKSELKTFTYFVLHRNKSGEGLMRLLLSSTTFLYLIPIYVVSNKYSEGMKVILDIYIRPIVLVKKVIFEGVLDSFFKYEVDSFNEREMKSVLYKVLKSNRDVGEEPFLDDFDVINSKDINYFLKNKGIEATLGSA